MAFTAFAVIFWIPALILLIIGLLVYKKKELRKLLLTLALISFSIPWVLSIGSRIGGQITQWGFQGTYVGQDSLANKITVVIEDRKFNLSVENCEESSITGSYSYSNSYDAFMFYAEKKCNISVYENYKGELMLTSDLKTSCANLNEVELHKK